MVENREREGSVFESLVLSSDEEFSRAVDEKTTIHSNQSIKINLNKNEANLSIKSPIPISVKGPGSILHMTQQKQKCQSF